MTTIMKIATGLTDHGPTELHVSHHVLATERYPFHGHPVTLIESVGAFQNAEPLVVYGRLSLDEARRHFLQIYHADTT